MSSSQVVLSPYLLLPFPVLVKANPQHLGSARLNTVGEGLDVAYSKAFSEGNSFQLGLGSSWETSFSSGIGMWQKQTMQTAYGKLGLTSSIAPRLETGFSAQIGKAYTEHMLIIDHYGSRNTNEGLLVGGNVFVKQHITSNVSLDFAGGLRSSPPTSSSSSRDLLPLFQAGLSLYL